VGSLRDPRFISKDDEFIAACRELGAALARAGIEIAVGSKSKEANVPDGHVIEGAAKVDGRHRIWILRPESDGLPDASSLDTGEGRIEILPRRVRGTWSAGFVPQILAVDAVLLIGGGNFTKTCGYVAPALERPVLAIASFGGAAKELWSDLEPYYGRLGKLSDQIGNLGEEGWESKNADLAVDSIKELVRRRIFKTKPRLPLAIYMFLLLACLFAWVFLFANPLEQRIYSFFAMLGVAGFLGTILRNNLRMVFDPTASFSWNELMIEVGAGLLLGFALALLYLVGSLAITGEATKFLVSPENEDFQRISVVMTLLGLGGGLMIEQAADRVRGWFTERLGSSEE
jgi:hypothetical protein